MVWRASAVRRGSWLSGETEGWLQKERKQMGRTLIIGAGGVGNVVAKKCAMNSDVFTDICLASRTLAKPNKIRDEIRQHIGRDIQTAQVDADDAQQVVELIKRFKPDIVINVALPYQDLPIMDACLETGVNYLDTANYEPRDVAKFEYKWQWAYQERFAEEGHHGGAGQRL